MKSLAASSALSAGSDIWVTAPVKISSWTQKIDWYLNFQITRFTQRKKTVPAPELQELWMKSFDFKIKEDFLEDDDEMVLLSSPSLPCKWVIHLPHWTEKKEISAALLKKISALNATSVRFFLPKNQAPHISKTQNLELSFVADANE